MLEKKKKKEPTGLKLAGLREQLQKAQMGLPLFEISRTKRRWHAWWPAVGLKLAGGDYLFSA